MDTATTTLSDRHGASSVNGGSRHAVKGSAGRRTGLPSVLFVRGCARSGTSLVVELLNDTAGIGILSEYALSALGRDLAPIFTYERAQNALDDVAARALVDTASDDAAAVAVVPAADSPTGQERTLRIAPRYEGADDVYFKFESAAPIPRYPTDAKFAAILTAVVEASLGKPDVRIIGSKTPGVRGEEDREAVASRFPAVRYLFVVRNPLLTINSIINRRNRARRDVDEWHVEDVAGAIREYRESIRSLFAHVARYGDDVFVLKYQDVVENYAEVSAKLSSFLGVPIAPTTTRIEAERGAKIVLTAEERAAVDSEFGDAIAAWPDKVLTGPGTVAVQALQDCIDVAVPGRKYRYGSALPDRHFLGLGWNELEEHGVWSSSPDADLFFSVAKEGEYAFCAEISTFATAAGAPVNVSIELNGEEIFRALAVPADAEVLDATAGAVPILSGAVARAVVCGPVRLRAGEKHRLTFVVDEVRSPASCGISEDARTLGVCLHSLVLVDVHTPRRARTRSH